MNVFLNVLNAMDNKKMFECINVSSSVFSSQRMFFMRGLEILGLKMYANSLFISYQF